MNKFSIGLWLVLSHGAPSGAGAGAGAVNFKDRSRLHYEEPLANPAEKEVIPIDIQSLVDEKSWKTLSRSQRALAVATMILGRPYLLGNAGEGKDGYFDEDPKFRFDYFDCVTLVETVLALSRSETSDAFFPILKTIRWDGGRIEYSGRRHFTEADWTPALIKSREISSLAEFFQWVGIEVRRVGGEIRKRPWYERKAESEVRVSGIPPVERRRRLKELRELGLKFSTAVPVNMEMLTIQTLRKKLTLIENSLPEFAVINVIRPLWPIAGRIGTDLYISHQAVWIRDAKGEGRVFHAASKAPAAVTVENLETFTSRISALPYAGGLEFLKVTE